MKTLNPWVIVRWSVVILCACAFGCWTWATIKNAQDAKRAAIQSAAKATESREQLQRARDHAYAQARGDQAMRVYDERMSELKDELRAVDSRERIRRAQAEADAAVRASDEKAAALGIPR